MHKHASTNRFYRLVWSHLHSCWVAVAEGARGRGKSAARKLSAALIGSMLAGGALAAPPDLAGFARPAAQALPAAPAPNALPTGAQVVAGQASVHTAGSAMTVLQGSDKAILNWQGFDIGANAGVRFVQPSAQSVALNRVLGNDPSRIYGQLSANGKVFLVNQNGVLFGASARVDVGSLVASSLALPDGEFLAGRYTFSGAANAGAVRNEGQIRSADGGYVALLGPSVANAGSIDAPNGSVALGAGEQVGVDLRGDGLITLRVDRGAVAALVDNSGLVQADGGRVELSAKGADALARATVNNTGLVQARGLVSDGGSIRLVGDGEVHAGALDAASRNGAGGEVAVAGRFVALDGAIDASGARGGSVDVKAAGTLSTAAATSVAGRAGAGGTVSYRSGGMLVESASAAIDASGAASGGSIGLHGDTGVLSSASYSARAANGSGGRIDVSGLDVRLLGAQLDASGSTQGGLVRVGGAFQGGAVRNDAPDLARFVTRWGRGAPIANAAATFIGDGTAIKVSASGRAGQGGTAVVWSEQQTTMLGSIDARGAGAAGTVEISSKDELRHVGLERIALGAGGQLLLDPKNITIGSGGATQWTYQAILGNGYSGNKDVGVPLTEGAMFGSGVALNAAGNRMAVGAPGDRGFDGLGDNLGAVHLYSFSDNNFSNASLQGTIGSGYTGGKNLNVNLQTGDQFGAAVALNADATRLAVGAVGDTGGAGAVHLIRFTDSQFSAPFLTGSVGLGRGTPGLENSFQFGVSVALNGAGDRLAAGSLYDNGATGSCDTCGAVYLFGNATGTPNLVKAIGAGYGVNMPLAPGAMFGTSVAFDGSGDRLAVGAIGVNNHSGAVYLYNNAYGATALSATIASGASGGKNLDPGLSVDDWFGSSVAFNSAGTRLAVGATDDGSGKVRIIDFADSAFSAPAVSAILAAGASGNANANVTLQPSEAFGFSLALNGAGDRLVVGSPFSEGSTGNVYDSGTVRAFALSAGAVGNLGFGTSAGTDAAVDAATLASVLDSGTSVTLQANNDITLAAGNALLIGDGSGNGALTLQAGRSIVLNSSITTGNANLTLVANDRTASGVVDAYRDAGAAGITVGAGTTIDAGSGQLSMTIADGAGKTNRSSGAIDVNGTLRGAAISLKNLGPSAGSNVVIGAGGSLAGSGSGTIEVVAGSGGTFINNAGAAGLMAGAGRYLVYSNNPGATLEGVSGYNKHYNQAYTGAAPAYAGSGNWFLYSLAPVLNVSAAAASKTYDGTTSSPALGWTVTGLIDGDQAGIVNGALGVTGLTRHVGSYAINAGTLGTDLGYTINYTGANLTVTPRPLDATVSGINKTYDGNTSATVIFGDNRIAGDVLALSGSASFADKHAASGKTVTVSGIALTGQDAANYTLASTSAATSASIDKRPLTATASGLNRTYNGGTSANVILSDNRIAGDLLSLTAASSSFVDKNAGSGKAVTVSGITLGGADAGNYVLASNSAATTADITRFLLTVGASGQDKTYDGNTAANVTFSDNRVNGDLLDFSANASFADRNAGDGKAISVSGIVVGGLDGANYTLASTTAAASANILKRPLAVNATGVNKTYDGNTTASVNFGDDRVNGDLLGYLASASFLDKNAGSAKTVNVSGILLTGRDAGNYVLASNSATTTADIARRALVLGASAAGKIYDGNTSAVVTLTDDRIHGDQLDVAGTGSFADKNAGSNKAVSVSGITLSGIDAANYTLAATSAATSASIARRTLAASVSALDKVYDGNTSVQFSMRDDRVAGDQLAVDSAAAGFSDKQVGAAKTVTVSGLNLAGQDAGNYTLASNSASTTAAITPRTLVVNAGGIDKVYDGTTAANVTLGDNRIAGDVLAIAHANAAFGDKHAGTHKTVTVNGLALSGADAGNYSLASNTAGTTAAITPRALAVSAAGVDKVYDGKLTASVVLGDDRINGDQLGVAGTASFADKNAGSNKAVSVSAIALSGIDAANYTLAATSAATSAAIAPKSLAAAIDGVVTKTYDGNATASLAAGRVILDGFVAGEGARVGALAGSFDSANVLQAGSVTAGLSGERVTADATTLLSNYRLPAEVAGAGAITPKALGVTGLRVDAKTYDGNTSASVAHIGTLEGLVAGESLQLSGPANARFATPGAGSGKLVTASGYRIGDGANGLAANYALSGEARSLDGLVRQATLTVKAGNATRAAGLDNPAFGYSVSGLVQGDSPALLPEFVTASSATRQSAPGDYAITVGSNATLNDYQLAYIDGVLSVTGAPPELTRAIRATIAPVLPLEVGGGRAVAQQQNGQGEEQREQQREQQQRELPRVDELRSAGGPAPVSGPGIDGTIVTLSGGTQVLTRNGGVRTAQ